MKTKRVPNFWPRAILLLVIAPVFAEVSPTTEPSAAVSTVSTLPPALPHGNNTDPCAFSDRISLLNRIDAESNQYNVTLLVETCPNVCLLALGSGNPDISGIGAMISYIFQGVGVFLCGPVMAIAILVFRIDLTAPSPRRPGLHNLLAKIALSINQGALFVALSIMIACVIRIRQSPPLGELSFITWLCMYQSIVGIGACVPSLLLLDFDKHRVISFNCYLCLIAVFYFTIGMMGRFSTAQRRILKQFNTHCVKKSLALFPLGEADYGNVLSAKDVIVLLLIAALCVLFGVATFFYKDQFMRVMSSIGRRFHTTPSHTVASLFVPPVAILWIFGCIYIGLSMYRSRNITRNLAGNSYQDEQWGFGQITILLLWGSVISDIILSVMDYHRTGRSRRSGQNVPLRSIQRSSGPLSNSSPQAVTQTPSQYGNNAVAQSDMVTPQIDSDENVEIRPLQEQPTSHSSSVSEATMQISGSDAATDRLPSQGIQPRQRTWPRHGNGTYLPTTAV